MVELTVAIVSIIVRLASHTPSARVMGSYVTSPAANMVWWQLPGACSVPNPKRRLDSPGVLYVCLLRHAPGCGRDLWERYRCNIASAPGQPSYNIALA